MYVCMYTYIYIRVVALVTIMASACVAGDLGLVLLVGDAGGLAGAVAAVAGGGAEVRRARRVPRALLTSCDDPL